MAWGIGLLGRAREVAADWGGEVGKIAGEFGFHPGTRRGRENLAITLLRLGEHWVARTRRIPPTPPAV